MLAGPASQVHPDPVLYPYSARHCAPYGGTHCPCTAARKLRSYSTSETGSAGCWTGGCSSTRHQVVNPGSRGLWSPEPPSDAASVTTWDTLASGSLLLSKLLFDVGLVVDFFRTSPLSPTT